MERQASSTTGSAVREIISCAQLHPCLITRLFFYLTAFHSTPKAHELAPRPNPRLRSPHHHVAVGVCLVVVLVRGLHMLDAAVRTRAAIFLLHRNGAGHPVFCFTTEVGVPSSPHVSLPIFPLMGGFLDPNTHGVTLKILFFF